MDADTLRREALALTPEQRAELAEELLSSLEQLSEEEIERLWLDEAEQRSREIDEGRARLYTAEEVRQQAQSLLR